jgi:hypothetical protein
MQVADKIRMGDEALPQAACLPPVSGHFVLFRRNSAIGKHTIPRNAITQLSQRQLQSQSHSGSFLSSFGAPDDVSAGNSRSTYLLNEPISISPRLSHAHGNDAWRRP